MKKELWVSVDYQDDVLLSGRHFTQADLNAMMAYIASLRATRVQWILDTAWTFYEDDCPGGFDLLAVACEAAHRHGMRFDTIFKPFEGALVGAKGLLPHGLPISDDAPVIHDRDGLIYKYRPVVARYPEMSLARMSGDQEDQGGPIRAIRLIKNDNAASPFALHDLSIWTSPRNGGYTEYTGQRSLSDSSGWRMLFPYSDKPVRIVTLSDLDLPPDTRYIMIRREDSGPDFRNAVEQIVELVDHCGGIIPSTPALRKADGEGIYEALKWNVEMDLTRFSRHPDARKIVNDRAGFLALCDGMRRFDAGWEDAILSQGSELVIARGKQRYRTGAMNPIYPEVRENWLDHIRFCIDRGVDGVNIRTSNHNSVYEPRYFGFNDAVVAQMDSPGNFGEARQLNGRAYTQFLREAAELLHAADREIGVQIKGLMLRHDDRAANSKTVPLNFEWQWETWVNEFADYVEYRGSFSFRPENQRPIADRIGFAARQSGIPFVFQSMCGPMVHFDGPHHALAHEMDWVRKHPDVAAYNLYEIAYFSRYDRQHGFQGSPDIAKLIDDHWSV